MIHVRVTRNPSTEQLDGIHISVTEESIPLFQKLINRALNCWDSAPKDIKDLGDMLTHGKVTQDHTYKPINTKQSTDYYSEADKAIITGYISMFGYDKWLEHVLNGSAHKVLKGEAV